MHISSKSSQFLSRLTLSWKLPVIGFGLALVATVWTAVWLQIASERRSMIESLAQESANLALVFEQSADRTASEIDRMLRYLRTTYERNGHNADWPTVVQEEFTANKRTVQIAIIDERGMMITSTKMLYPATPVDLSDREHYKVHATARIDRLFISKPLLGRASNKWSVQFTRPFFKGDGSFAGVMVVSLDPEFLTNYFSALSLGADGGVALVGDDGIVRAGAGIYKDLLGKPMPSQSHLGIDVAASSQARVHVRDDGGRPLASAICRGQEFPLHAIVTRSDAPQYASWLKNRGNYMIGAGIFTLLVFAALGTSITRRRGYERRLNRLARFDTLTELPNRQEFSAQVAAISADRRPASTYSIFMIDLDDFKAVNDTYGHAIGDALLLAVGARLRRNVRSTDIVARLGGNEFAIIELHSAAENAADTLAQRLCKALSEPYDIENVRIECSASIGIATNSGATGSDDSLMRSADLALYAAKNSGGGTYRHFDEHMNEEARKRREIEIGLQEALRASHLELHYQPIVKLSSREMTGVEALVRWRHPEKGLIPPGDFIPIAERTGLIVPIGAFVVARACSDIAARSDTLSVAVNVSAIEFRDSNVADTVMHALDASGLAPNRLKIEITESLLMRKDAVTLGQLHALRQLGVCISMDDFGTGYSSLSYLHSYPIDCIKIDQSFVRGIGTIKHSQAIIRAICELGKCMGMTTIAEGVETEEQYLALKGLGCQEVQGYLLGRPQPIDALFPAPRLIEAPRDQSAEANAAA